MDNYITRSESHVSRNRLDEIGMGDPSFTVDLIDIMLLDGEDRVQGIRASFDAGAIEEVGRTAHSLKGAALNVGALTLATLCAELDDTVRKLKLTITDEQIAQVEEEFTHVKAELLSIKEELSA